MHTCATLSHRSVSISAADVSFDALLPAIRRTVAYAFRHARSAVRSELIDAAVARAFEMYARLVQQGRASIAYATALANYAVRQVRSGRVTGSRQNARDVFSPLAQQKRQFSVVSLTSEVLAECRRVDPAKLAALRIDFAAWIANLSPMKRALAIFLAVGHTTSEAARRYSLSQARISQIRRELQASWELYQATPTI